MPQLGPFLIISDANPQSWCYFNWDTEGVLNYYTAAYQPNSAQASWQKQANEITLYVFEPIANYYAYYVISDNTIYRVPVMSYGTERVINAVQEARIIDSTVKFDMSRNLKAKDFGMSLKHDVLLDDALAKATINLIPSIPIEELKTANNHFEQLNTITTVSVSRARELLQVKTCQLLASKPELQDSLSDGVMVVWKENKQWFYQVGLLGEQLSGEWDNQLDRDIVAALNQRKNPGDISNLNPLQLSRPYLKLTPWQQGQVIDFISIAWPLSDDFSVNNQIRISRSIIRGSLITDDDKALPKSLMQSSSEEIEIINQVNQFRPNLFPSCLNNAFGTRFYSKNDPSDALIADIIRYIQRLFIASIRELGDTQEITTQAISNSSQVKCGQLAKGDNSSRLIYNGLCTRDSELLQLITQFESGLLDNLTEKQLDQLKLDITGIMNPAVDQDYMDLANDLLAVIQVQQNLSSGDIAKLMLTKECLEILDKIYDQEIKRNRPKLKKLFELKISEAINRLTINSLSSSRDSIADLLSIDLIDSNLSDQQTIFDSDDHLLNYIIKETNAFNLSVMLGNLSWEAQITLFEFLGRTGLTKIVQTENFVHGGLPLISNKIKSEAYPTLFKFLDHALLESAIKDVYELINALNKIREDKLVILLITLTTEKLIIKNSNDLVKIMCFLKTDLRINFITLLTTNCLKDLIQGLPDLTKIALTLPLETRLIFFKSLNNELLLNCDSAVLNIKNSSDRAVYLNKKIEELFYIKIEESLSLRHQFEYLPKDMHADFLNFIGEAKIRSIYRGESECYNNNDMDANTRETLLSYFYTNELADMLNVLNPSAHVLLINLLGVDVLKFIIKDLDVLGTILGRLYPEALSIFIQLFTVKKITEFGYPLTNLLSILSPIDRINVVASFSKKDIASMLKDYRQLSLFFQMQTPENQAIFITSLDEKYLLTRIKDGDQLTYLFNLLAPEVRLLFKQSLSDESCKLMIGDQYILYQPRMLELRKILIKNLSLNVLEWMIKDFDDLNFVIKNIPAGLRYNFLLSLNHDKLKSILLHSNISPVLKYLDNPLRIKFIESFSDELSDIIFKKPFSFISLLGELANNSRLPYLKSLSVSQQFKILVTSPKSSDQLIDILKTLEPNIRHEFLSCIDIKILNQAIPSTLELINVLNVLTAETRINFLTSLSPNILKTLFGGNLFSSLVDVIKLLSSEDQDKFLNSINEKEIESIGASGCGLADCIKQLPEEVLPRFLRIFEGKLKSIALLPREYRNNSLEKFTYDQQDWTVLYQFFVHPTADPAYKAFINHNPESFNVFSASINCIHHLEKKLQSVQSRCSEQTYKFFGYKSSSQNKLLADLTSAQWLDSLLTGEKPCCQNDVNSYSCSIKSAETQNVFLAEMCQSMIQELIPLSNTKRPG